jgi:DNA-binding NarL/FixJ family response regulator
VLLGRERRKSKNTVPALSRKNPVKSKRRQQHETSEGDRHLQRFVPILAAVSNGALAVQSVAEMEPDAVVMDIHMPELGGIEAAQSLKRSGSAVKVVFLTIETDPEYIGMATAMGASYVVKSRIRKDLRVAVKEALAGRVFVSSR